jgi:hypothetical protein
MTEAALNQLPLQQEMAARLCRLVQDSVNDAIEKAYPPGESGQIRVAIKERHGKLELLIRDYGLPQDIDALEQEIHDPNCRRHRIDSELAAAVDDIHWLGFGRDGKALQIIKWLDEGHIADRADPDQLRALESAAPLAPEQNYEVRRMRADEAVQVSQLMYRAYGNTYFNEDVYYPERIAAQNAHDVNLSFVAVGENGTVAGHYALELNQPGPVAEGGQAVVDPAHRGRGLLNRLKAAALEAATERQLAGWYADAVAVHTFTQQSNVTHGGHLTAIDLGIAPRTELFRNISGEQPQRVTCLLYFHWLKKTAPRRVSCPERHQKMISAIYSNLGCGVEFLREAEPQGSGTLAVQVDPGGAKAFLRADILGEDTIRTIRRAQRELIGRARVEAIYVDLPVENPATATISTGLEQMGFGFSGIAPHFSKQGDMLRLAYLVEPLQREPIQVYEEFGQQLVDYVLAEQARVRSN